MSMNERELEENEAKLDNLLHKITESAKHIQELKNKIDPNDPTDYNIQLLDQIDMLAKIIQELAEAADLIDVTDETITKQLENNIKGKLDEAIEHIQAARNVLQQ